MIDIAIAYIARQLNESLRQRFGIAEDLVVASNLLEQDGGVVPEVANKMAVFLVNVERETITYRTPATNAAGVRQVSTAAPVALNLMVMFAANFSGNNYAESLKFLSGTIAFFQSHSSFDPQKDPGLDPRIERLTLEIENLNTAELSNLWGILSGKYLPSILYRIRMVTIDEQQVVALPMNVMRLQTEVAP